MYIYSNDFVVMGGCEFLFFLRLVLVYKTITSCYINYKRAMFIGFFCTKVFVSKFLKFKKFLDTI